MIEIGDPVNVGISENFPDALENPVLGVRWLDHAAGTLGLVKRNVLAGNS